MTIKVVSIVSRMNLGGVAILLSNLHDELRPPEFAHTLISGACSENEIDVLDGKLKDEGIFRLKSMGRAPSPFKDLVAFFQIRRIIKEIQPDIVHTHTTKAGVLGRIAAKSISRKIKIIHTFHGHHLYGYFSQMSVILMVLVEKILCVFTDLLVADSNQVMLDLIEKGVGKGSNWKVIAPGVRIPEFIPRARARQILNLPSEDFVICWLGRFTDIKDPLLALAALRELLHTGNHSIRMIMVGDGELLEVSKDFASVNALTVDFTGWELDPNIYLASSNLLLLTSKNEGFGMVVAEAACFGVPAVANDIGGVREFITDQVNGILTAASPKNIAEAILNLANNETFSNQLGESARLTTLEKFSIDAFVEKHKEMYRKTEFRS